MSWFSKEAKSFPWENLTSHEQLADALAEDSFVLLFKHSTRCSISSMAISKFESKWNTSQPVRLLYLDLLNYRSISNEIADKTGITHQSPQAILLKGGKVLYHNSHSGISANEIEELLKNH